MKENLAYYYAWQHNTDLNQKIDKLEAKLNSIENRLEKLWALKINIGTKKQNT